MRTGKAQGRPRIIKRVVTKKTYHYKNNDALYNTDAQRRQFINNIKAFREPSNRLNVAGTHTPCGFNPPCRHDAVEAWVYATHTEYLCKVELEALQAAPLAEWQKRREKK